MDGIYLKLGDETQGPYSFQEVETFWQQARINTRTQFWDPGSNAWKPIDQLLFPPVARAESPALPPRTRRPVYRLTLKRTWSVIVLAIIGMVLALAMFFMALIASAEMPEDTFLKMLSIRFGLAFFVFATWLSIMRMYRWGLGLLMLVIAYHVFMALQTGDVLDYSQWAYVPKLNGLKSSWFAFEWILAALNGFFLLLLLRSASRMRWR